MEIGQNSVHYDPETKELRVVTCYNKLQYKTLWVQDPFLRSMRYLLYTKDPEATGLPALRGFRVYFWVLRLMVLVAALYLLSRGLYYFSIPSGWFSGALMTGASLALFFWAVRLRALWMGSYNKMVHRTKVPKAFRFTWEAIDQGFADRPVFRQEVVLTPEGYTLNTPIPGCPPSSAAGASTLSGWFRTRGMSTFCSSRTGGAPRRGMSPLPGCTLPGAAIPTPTGPPCWGPCGSLRICDPIIIVQKKAWSCDHAGLFCNGFPRGRAVPGTRRGQDPALQAVSR